MIFDQGSGRLASGRTAGTSSARTLALKPLAERATLERGQVRRISVLRCSRPAARPANIGLIDCRDTVAPRRALPWSLQFVSLGLDRSLHISVRPVREWPAPGRRAHPSFRASAAAAGQRERTSAG
jgi:hypothetical protein